MTSSWMAHGHRGGALRRLGLRGWDRGDHPEEGERGFGTLGMAGDVAESEARLPQ